MERCGVYVDNMVQGGFKNKYQRNTHKFGIEVPKTVEDDLDIDRKMDTELWEKSIRKDMTNVRILFENLDGVTPQQI